MSAPPLFDRSARRLVAACVVLAVAVTALSGGGLWWWAVLPVAVLVAGRSSWAGPGVRACADVVARVGVWCLRGVSPAVRARRRAERARRRRLRDQRRAQRRRGRLR